MTNNLSKPVVAGVVLHCCAVKTAAHAALTAPIQQETKIPTAPLTAPFLRTAYLCRFPEHAVTALIKIPATVLATMSAVTHQISTSYFSTVYSSPFVVDELR